MGVSPYRAPEASGAQIPAKKGKNHKISLPGLTPEIREKLPKNCKNGIFGVFFVIFR